MNKEWSVYILWQVPGTIAMALGWYLVSPWMTAMFLAGSVWCAVNRILSDNVDKAEGSK